MFNVYEIILLFFIFSFVGWLWEVILELIQHHKLVNRGFLIGPCLPIYGVGGLLSTLFFSKIDIFDGFANVVVVFIATSVICSILEYFTSWAMEQLFNNRWWDYSNFKINLNGRICLLCSLGFGLGCTADIYLVNPFLRYLFDLINIPIDVIKAFDLIALFLFSIDIVVSFKIINNFKNISNSVVEDSTDKITAIVRKTILKNYNIFYQRLVKSFPNMQIRNKLSILRDKIYDEQKKLEKATYKLDIRRRRIKQYEKELNSEKVKGFKNKIKNFFKKK